MRFILINKQNLFPAHFLDDPLGEFGEIVGVVVKGVVYSASDFSYPGRLFLWSSIEIIFEMFKGVILIEQQEKGPAASNSVSSGGNYSGMVIKAVSDTLSDQIEARPVILQVSAGQGCSFFFSQFAKTHS